MEKLRQRLAREEGFTLIELLVVIVIIGILLAIAVPSYLGFKDRANNRAAQADIRAAIPSVEAYYADNGTYTGVTTTTLKVDRLGSLLGSRGRARWLPTATASAATVGGKSWSVNGPGRHGLAQRDRAAPARLPVRKARRSIDAIGGSRAVVVAGAPASRNEHGIDTGGGVAGRRTKSYKS